MKDNPTRRISSIMFRLMAYSPPTIQVPSPGAVLTEVTVVNPGLERLDRQTAVVEGDRITSISPSEP